MTINSTAIILLALYVAVARRQRRARRRRSPGTVQNDILKEYVARGTYIYPPRPSLRIVTDIFAFCERDAAELEHDLDQRLPHPRGRRRPRCRKSPSPSPTRSPTSRRRAQAGLDVNTLRAAALVLLQRPQRFLRGDREVPRGAAAVGAHHARPLRRDQPARAAAALPHPDRRQHADRAAAGQQHRPRRDPGAGGGARAARSRSTATAATRRSALPTEESARIALRTQQIIASESGVAEHRRSGRRRLRRSRQMTNRIERGSGRAARADRRGRRHARGDRAGIHPARDPGVGLSRAAGHRQRRQRRRRRQPVHASSETQRSRCCASIRTSSARQTERVRQVRAVARPVRLAKRRSTRSGSPRAGRTISCRRSSRRSRPTRRSARSRMRCGRCSGSTRRSMSEGRCSQSST